MERYTEDENIASEYRKNYMDGLTALIKRKQAEKNKERVERFTKNLDNLENERLEFKKMLGWPLVTGDSHKPSMRIEYLGKTTTLLFSGRLPMSLRIMRFTDFFSSKATHQKILM